MKRYFILLTFSIGLFFSANAQSKSYKMYDAFDEESGITNFSFSKNMLDAIDLDLGDEDDGDERRVTGDLNKVTFMSYNPRKGDLSGPEFIKKAIRYLPKSSYHKYIDPDGDGDDDAEIWLMGKKKKYKECHVFFKNDNRNSIHFVVSFYGDFTVSDMDEIRKLGRELSD